MGQRRAAAVHALPTALITLRNAQVRRISWVRGVRPVRGRYEWPPHDAAPDRPPISGALTAPIHSLTERNTKSAARSRVYPRSAQKKRTSAKAELRSSALF